MSFKLSNTQYDWLKWIAQVFLPAVAALYCALAGIWGFPYAEQIVGTITAVDTFLGILLGISSKQYNTSGKYDGTLKIDSTDPKKDSYLLAFDTDLDEVKSKDEVTFKIEQTK